MGKVISLRDRLETWNTAYDANGVSVGVSSHGRFRICTGGSVTYLDMVDSVDLLGRVSEALDAEMSVLFEEAPAPAVVLR